MPNVDPNNPKDMQDLMQYMVQTRIAQDDNSARRSSMQTQATINNQSKMMESNWPEFKISDKGILDQLTAAKTNSDREVMSHKSVSQGATIPEGYKDWRQSNIADMTSLLSLKPGTPLTDQQLNALLGQMGGGSVKLVSSGPGVDRIGKIIREIGNEAFSRLQVRNDKNVEVAIKALLDAEKDPLFRSRAAILDQIEKHQTKNWLKAQADPNSPFVGQAQELSKHDIAFRGELHDMLKNHMERAIISDLDQTIKAMQSAKAMTKKLDARSHLKVVENGPSKPEK